MANSFSRTAAGLLAMIHVLIGSQQRQSVERSGLVVVGIGFVRLLHRCRVGRGTCFIVSLSGAGVESLDCGEVCLLARSGVLLQLVPGFDFLLAPGDHFRVGLIPELVPQAHRDSPMRHGALRIVFGDLQKFLFRFLVPERMQQGDSALERLLHRCRTGDRKMNRA